MITSLLLAFTVLMHPFLCTSTPNNLRPRALDNKTTISRSGLSVLAPTPMSTSSNSFDSKSPSPVTSPSPTASFGGSFGSYGSVTPVPLPPRRSPPLSTSLMDVVDGIAIVPVWEMKRAASSYSDLACRALKTNDHFQVSKLDFELYAKGQENDAVAEEATDEEQVAVITTTNSDALFLEDLENELNDLLK